MGLGVTPQETSLPGTLRVAEVLDQVAAHFPDPAPVDRLLQAVDLADLARRPTAKLSGGQRRRLAVALALVGRPRLVVLDEPTTGLDTASRAAVWELLEGFHAAGGTILFASHHLEEVERLAERVVVVDHGRILLDDALPAVLAGVDVRHVTLRTDPVHADAVARATGAAPALAGGAAPVGGVASADGASPTSAGAAHSAENLESDRLRFLVRDSDAVVRGLVASGLPFADLTVRGATLEEALAAITARTPGAPEGGEGS